MSGELTYYLDTIQNLSVQIYKVKQQPDYESNPYLQQEQRKLWGKRERTRYKVHKMIEIQKNNS